MYGKNGARVDTSVMILSVIAVLVAATLTMATISGGPEETTGLSHLDLETPDPIKRAEIAANAGFEAARNHIECHGRITAGQLSPRYFANGATYAVEWDDVNMSDSTTTVRSKAAFSWGGGQNYQVEFETTIKLEFLPSHGQEILSDYYSIKRATFETLSEK